MKAFVSLPPGAARKIGLAAAGLLVLIELVLAVTKGAVGIPGVYLISLRNTVDSTPVASNGAGGGETVIVKRTPPPVAIPVPAESGKPSQAANPAPQPGSATPPPANTTQAANAPATPQTAQGAKPRQGGPVGWAGPSTAPDQPDLSAAAPDAPGPAPKLSGPIDLNVRAAVNDLDKAEEDDKKKGQDPNQAQGQDPSQDQQPGGEAAAAASQQGDGSSPSAPLQPGQNEVLPWDQVKPDPALTGPLKITPKTVAPQQSADATVTTPQTSQVAPAAMPAAPSGPPLPFADSVRRWVKSAALPNQGVDGGGRPLYRFDLWLEPPADIKERLVAVTYDIDAPSVQPAKQRSTDSASGFRVQFGALACADHITLTLSFADGQTEQVAVNGCTILG